MAPRPSDGVCGSAAASGTGVRVGPEGLRNADTVGLGPRLPGLPGNTIPGRAVLMASAISRAAPLSPVPPAAEAHADLAALERASRVQPPRRRRLWELGDSLHCSIIGTCLTTHELRRLTRRLGLGEPQATDHALHTIAVSLAGREGAAARLISKALDEQHRAAIRRFEKAADTAALRALWREAVQAGEIPGAYWAVLTHPAADQRLVIEVFGEVHMLSHLVGAANRADIRRLAAQEREIAALRETVARQQERLRADITERDGRIRDLQAMLAARAAAGAEAPKEVGGRAELPRLVADLGRRLDVSERRREAAERRSAAALEALAAARARAAAAERQAVALAAEIGAAEAALAAADTSAAVGGPPPPPARTVLYVGGRTGQAAALRRGAERLGAVLVHHDGGTEAGAGLLAGLVGRADLVVFPVECVSHEAALAVKKLCRQTGRPFVPLRSAGLSSLLAALARPARSEV